MVSTHPGDHNNEKIKIGQTSQFSAIACFFVIVMTSLNVSCQISNVRLVLSYYDRNVRNFAVFAPFSEKGPLAR